ncbi:hypothetical protein BC835DRAFT_1417742 [Cytidiella melzeri]|nr:hypothetical protein BC835DRAFT_1417742 [Cytidiella melzeri]
MTKLSLLVNFLALVSYVSALNVSEKRATGGYVQRASGTASFTQYTGCGTPAYGTSASGFTAAVDQLAFGAAPGSGAGDACGRCFAITGIEDPSLPTTLILSAVLF